MSGPKVTEIESGPRLKEREENRARCLATLSEYERLFHEMLTVRARLADFGEATKTDLKDPGQVGEAANSDLNANRDREAVAAARLATESLKSDLRSASKRLADLRDQFQMQCLKFEGDMIRLSSARAQLEILAASGKPKNIAAAEAESIAARLSYALASSEPPKSPEAVFTREGMARLTEAQEALDRSQEAVDSTRSEFEKLFRDLHRRDILGSFQRDTRGGTTIESWIADNPDAERRSEEEIDWTRKAEGLLKIVASLHNSPRAGQLAAAVADLHRESSASRRRQIYERLAIQCDRELQNLRRHQARADELDALLDRLAAWTCRETESIASEIKALKSKSTASDLSGIRARVDAAVERERLRRRAVEHRQAIVGALRELGYEIEEGMETAIVSGGRLVFQKDGDEGYALEAVTNSQGTLMQTEMVRCAQPTGPDASQRQRDIEREISWCQDYAALRDKLAARGYSAKNKLAVPAGTKELRHACVKPKRRRRRTHSQERSARRP